MGNIERSDPAREALEYLREHHLDGNECLCDAARSVVESGLSLSEQQQRGAVVVDDAAVERLAKALMDTPTDMLTAEPYTVARALLAAAGGQYDESARRT